MANFHPGKRTIGFLTNAISDGTGRQLWSGVAEQCRASGIDLVTFIGSELESPAGFSRQANTIFELIDRERLHGLVIWASSLAAYVGPDAILHFCERYRPLPLVGIGLPLPGIPSIVLDSYQGMREALLHLVQEHNRRRLAFLRGPEQHREAQQRYQAYLDVVAEYGLANDPGLVTPPYTWGRAWGDEATRMLVEGGQKFDAIACVNDGLAMGAMDYLARRGMNVPREIAITGFDNGLEGRVITPPLTTVPIRMRERGRQAVRLLLAQMNGRAVPDLLTLPTHVLVRQSCGCPDPLVVQAGLPPAYHLFSSPAEEQFSWKERFELHRDEIIAEMERALDLEDLEAGWANHLLDAFLNKLAAQTGYSFPTSLQWLLRQSTPVGGDLFNWQKVVNVLRARALPLLRADPAALDRAERYLHQARIMIGEAALRAQGHQDWRSTQQLNQLHHIRQRVSGAQDMHELVESLARELPRVGIRRSYLALYPDPTQPMNSARLVLAYDETRRYPELEGQVFAPAWQFAPPPVDSEQPQSMVAYPLFFRDEPLGFILLDAQTFQGTVHQVLCEQIGSAVKSVLLIEQNLQLYRQALEAQRVAEEANLLKSRFLSMVSHELLTPMVLLVGLSEMMLREGIGDRPPLPEAYRQDLTRIHAGAQQLGSLVRDVLDLTRRQLGQLKLTPKKIDLSEVLKPVALVGEQMTRSKGLAWRATIAPDLPQVMGDAARLQQVALNLVSNAVKFTSRGEVALIVTREGPSIRVAIQDTGLGVPLAEQSAIFDEFRQSERTVARGYGGLGIGLAICRQLIELHNGQIGVWSSGEENGGSTFYFSLPVPAETAALPVQVSSQAVLILTHRVERVGLIREHLLQQGFQIEIMSITDLPDWLPRVVSNPPGAVVLDLPTPEHGWELIEALKSSPATQDIPVIFYSPLPEAGSSSMLAFDYLAKPVAASSLGQALQRYGLSGGDCGDPRTVLVVDDDPNILNLHARLVSERIPGCRVLCAANGQIALALMREKPPALVLLDLMMPELDGVGVLNAMQNDERLRLVPVIVLTAQTLTQDEMARLNRGVAAVLSKGVFTPEETLAHIDQALARSKRLGSEAQRLVRRVMAYIHEHYPEDLSREQLAAYAGVSERHLNRCFLQETGLAPVAYLNRYRIQQARVLLADRSRTITDVMGAVGFSDSSYFTRVFRREAGVSPSEYQRGKIG